MLDDLRNYRAPRPFDWLRDMIEQDPALLLAVIVAALLMDRLA